MEAAQWDFAKIFFKKGGFFPGHFGHIFTIHRLWKMGLVNILDEGEFIIEGMGGMCPRC